MHKYQDTWVKGKVAEYGERDCAPRYEAIREVAARFKRPFTVLDIGANLGYFSLRLAEDFDCTVLAVEAGPWLNPVLCRNENPRVLGVQRSMSFDDLRELADVEHFDLVLGLSVTHHFDAPYADVLGQIRRLGFATILELPTEPNACGQSSVRETFVPDDAELLGTFGTHLGGMRPLVLLTDKNPTLARSYWKSPVEGSPVKIACGWSKKTKTIRGVSSPWLRGINLETWLQLGPVFPSREYVARLLADSQPVEKHGDLKAWNVVLQGDAVRVIDFRDPRWAEQPDGALWDELVKRVKG
jgi:SAM-dependent methyltransferase